MSSHSDSPFEEFDSDEEDILLLSHPSTGHKKNSATDARRASNNRRQTSSSPTLIAVRAQARSGLNRNISSVGVVDPPCQAPRLGLSRQANADSVSSTSTTGAKQEGAVSHRYKQQGTSQDANLPHSDENRYNLATTRLVASEYQLDEGVTSNEQQRETPRRTSIGGTKKGRVTSVPAVESSSSTAATESSAQSAGGVMNQPHVSLEKRNVKIGRALRVTQREFVSGGTREIQTKVDVFDLTSADCPVIFSVKHLHSGVWGRQTIVHKNLMLACILADVASPLDIPSESRRIFEHVDQQDHMHTYLERVTPFIRYNKIPRGVSLYWWRAVGNGTAVLQNNYSGKMLFFVNKDKFVPSAAETLNEVIKKASSLPDTFFDVNPSYPLEFTDEDKERIPNPDAILPFEAIKKLVLDDWALADGVGPWTTDLVLHVEGPRRRLTNIRYSIGFCEAQDNIVLAIQVHKNEPLVRDLKAFPICVLQMKPRSSTLSEVYLAYKRARFFLQKLFKFHVEYEQTGVKGSVSTSLSPATPSKATTPCSSYRQNSVTTPCPTRTHRASSVRNSHIFDSSTILSPSSPSCRQDAITPPRGTPRHRRGLSNLRGSLPNEEPVSVKSQSPYKKSYKKSDDEGSHNLSFRQSAGTFRASVVTPTKFRSKLSTHKVPSNVSNTEDPTDTKSSRFSSRLNEKQRQFTYELGTSSRGSFVDSNFVGVAPDISSSNKGASSSRIQRRQSMIKATPR